LLLAVFGATVLAARGTTVITTGQQSAVHGVHGGGGGTVKVGG
jgi:hypothetical protein